MKCFPYMGLGKRRGERAQPLVMECVAGRTEDNPSLELQESCVHLYVCMWPVFLGVEQNHELNFGTS